MTPLTQALTEALLHSLWQGVLAAGLLWTMLFLLRTRSPNSRYVAGCAILFGQFALFLITAGLAYGQQRLSGPALSADLWSAIAATTEWIATVKLWMFPIWAAGV